VTSSAPDLDIVYICSHGRSGSTLVGSVLGLADGYCYVAAIPTYVGGHMAMGWATDNTKMRQLSVKTIAERYRKAGRFQTKYWTPEVHVAAFALPRFIAENVAKANRLARRAGAESRSRPTRSRRRN